MPALIGVLESGKVPTFHCRLAFAFLVLGPAASRSGSRLCWGFCLGASSMLEAIFLPDPSHPDPSHRIELNCMKLTKRNWTWNEMKWNEIWVSEWVTDWLTEWMNERMNEWTNERMNEWTSERVNEWMSEWVNERMNEWTVNEWTNEWINQSTNQSINQSSNQSISQSMKFADLIFQFFFTIFMWNRAPKVLGDWSFLTFSSANRALATVSCTFCQPHLPKVVVALPNYLMMMWLTWWCG